MVALSQESSEISGKGITRRRYELLAIKLRSAFPGLIVIHLMITGSPQQIERTIISCGMQVDWRESEAYYQRSRDFMRHHFLGSIGRGFQIWILIRLARGLSQVKGGIGFNYY